MVVEIAIEGYVVQVTRKDDHFEAMVRNGQGYHVLRADHAGKPVAFFSVGSPMAEDSRLQDIWYPSNACRKAMEAAVERVLAEQPNGR